MKLNIKMNSSCLCTQSMSQHKGVIMDCVSFHTDRECCNARKESSYCDMKSDSTIDEA